MPIVSPLVDQISHIVRKQDFCLCENKEAYQLCSYSTADYRLCFRYTDSTISLLLKSKIASFLPASVTVYVGLCQTRSETSKTDFLVSSLVDQNIPEYQQILFECV